MPRKRKLTVEETEASKAKALRDKLLERIYSRELTDFLLAEVDYIVEKTNYYKLLNLKKNFSIFKEFIIDLNKTTLEKGHLFAMKMEKYKIVTALWLNFSEFCHRGNLLKIRVEKVKKK